MDKNNKYIPNFNCPICNKQFKNLRNLSYHFSSIHQLSVYEWILSNNSVEIPKCVECKNTIKLSKRTYQYLFTEPQKLKFCSNNCKMKQKFEYQKGKHHTKEHKYKIGKSVSISLTGNKLSDEHKMKLSLAKRGKNHPLFGKHLSDETKRKMRIAALNYIEKIRGNISPNIGKNETQLLDEQEQKDNSKILRQFHIKDLG